ncbi:Lrp/AsnC family transcriptional regulator [Candidatus Micrarchaeota archaeon]|nr:Lrp/AsnC family transcriptional regulator [Candidatus Micrarchaeota archaeon]
MKERLDKIDRRLLYELDWNARQAETELAKKIGRSRETVRYRIAQLEKNGVISGYTTWIDVARLGYNVYKIYLKIGGTEEEREEFFTAMKGRADLFWLGIADGAWDVGLTFFAKSNEDFFERKNEIFAKYSPIILQKFTGAMVEVYVYPKKFLYQAEEERIPFFGKVEDNRLDDVDRKILSELFRNSRVKLVELAAKAGVSVDIARGRMKSMKEKGIIVGYRAQVDYQKLGMEFYKSFLYFDSFSKEDERKLFEIAKQDQNILHLIKLISPWDIELEIMVENYQDYNKIIRHLKAEFPNLRNVESATMSGDFVFPAKETIMKL